MLLFKLIFKLGISLIILLYKKFLQFDWLREVVFQLTGNLKYLHVNLLHVVV